MGFTLQVAIRVRVVGVHLVLGVISLGVMSLGVMLLGVMPQVVLLLGVKSLGVILEVISMTDVSLGVSCFVASRGSPTLTIGRWAGSPRSETSKP